MKKRFDRIYIEISNICNLQCDFCPEVKRTKKVMSTDLFKSIIDQVKDLTEEVTFHLMGEPLAHPKFKEFVRYCEEQEVKINLTTNGTLLAHRDNTEILLSKAIRQVNFSLQSFTSNFPQGDIAKYLESIFSYVRSAELQRPDLFVNFRLWNMGTHEASVLENRYFIEPIEKEFNLIFAKKIDVGFRKSHKLRNKIYLHFDSRFEWPSLQREIVAKNGFCYGLKSHFAIHADGTVVPCCLDKEADISLGQASALPILKILNDERARLIVAGFERFERREELCQRCSFINRFAKKSQNIDRLPKEQ